MNLDRAAGLGACKLQTAPVDRLKPDERGLHGVLAHMLDRTEWNSSH